MQERKIGNLLGEWLKRRWKAMVLVILMMLNYISVAALSHLNLEPILYSTLICLFVGFWIIYFDFKKYMKQYKALLNTYHNRGYSVEGLPMVGDLIETSYQQIINALFEDILSLRQKIIKKEEEANDYYTLWTHQIKTPIAAMRLMLQNQKYKNEEYSQENRLVLEGELFKIEQYAEMALGYLRLESMSQDLILKSYSLYDIVAKALKKFSIYFMSKKLSIDIEAFDVKVITDEKWLQFVIEQIISNSVKYTHTGKITIRMKDEQTLEISDTGIGIQSEDLPRIFERGFTGYNGRIQKKSTGIGLYLCKKVTSKHLK